MGGHACGRRRRPVRSPAIRCATPVVDLVEIGAGGGSIAWVDSGGLLRVGPRSAGADPGPVCYRRGGVEPTVTDANVVLGRLNPAYFLGGEIGARPRGRERRDRGALREAARPRARRGGERDRRDRERRDGQRAPPDLRAARLRPAGVPALGFGGAGPVHANAIARDAEMPAVLIPREPGHLLGHRPADDRPEARRLDHDHAPPRRARPRRDRRRLPRARAAGRRRDGRGGPRRRGGRVRPPARRALRRPELRADDRRARTLQNASRRGTARALPRRARPHLRLLRTGRAGRMRQPPPDHRRQDREAAAAPLAPGRRLPTPRSGDPSRSPRQAATSTVRSTTATPSAPGLASPGRRSSRSSTQPQSSIRATPSRSTTRATY